jgi:hypothetical protein
LRRFEQTFFKHLVFDGCRCAGREGCAEWKEQGQRNRRKTSRFSKSSEFLIQRFSLGAHQHIWQAAPRMSAAPDKEQVIDCRVLVVRSHVTELREGVREPKARTLFEIKHVPPRLRRVHLPLQPQSNQNHVGVCMNHHPSLSACHIIFFLGGSGVYHVRLFTDAAVYRTTSNLMCAVPGPWSTMCVYLRMLQCTAPPQT